MELTGLQIFQYLKQAGHFNCKECGCATCMAFALKLAKTNIEKCLYAPDELKALIAQNARQPQKTITVKGVKVGGENVLYRHEKKFNNPTALAVIADKLPDFKIKRVNEELGVDLALTREEYEALPMTKIVDRSFKQTAAELVRLRKEAIEQRNEADPVCVYLPLAPVEELCAKAAYYICKYANMLVFENFDETLFSVLLTLRQNIFTDPEKPMQVEPGVYEFNEPDENSPVFMTTNFALTYFAVANELENLNTGSYLVVVPSGGMSVLTAWSAEKFTAQVVAKTLKEFKLSQRKIIIPGLLAHMKEELEQAVPEFEFIVGTNEAYGIGDFCDILKA
jgi:CO dehydrogenase/acetyl-CoA synthase gamma subunit (corrinoid Fe-S protein)